MVHHFAPVLGVVLLGVTVSLIGGGAVAAIRRARVREVESRYTAMMEERTRLAREIHDTLLQGFAGVTLMVAAVAREVSDPLQAAALEHAADVAERRLREARKFVWDLRDASNEWDLMAAIRAEADGAVKETRGDLEFVTEGPPRPVDAEATKVILRVTREAITNAVRHANATRLHVRLSFQPDLVRLSVRDDGIGFTVRRDFRSYGDHWGLRGMWEHAAQIGAALRVNSTPGAGTEVVLAVLPQSRKLKRTG